MTINGDLRQALNAYIRLQLDNCEKVLSEADVKAMTDRIKDQIDDLVCDELNNF